MLPAPLRILAKAFNVLEKLYFLYKFTNTHSLDYIGKIPKFKNFKESGISKMVYNQYCKQFKNKD
jgi:hypothetical protein